MESYISLLRGINVSGQKKINMNDLKSLFENKGFKDVKTYIQSGNLIFSYKSDDVNELTDLTESIIYEKYGFEVKAIIRTKNEIKEDLHNNPFLKSFDFESKNIYFTFLREEINPELIKNIDSKSFEPDLFYYSGKNIYVYCPDGYGKTKLNNNFFERKLKVTATTRNLKTVEEIIKLLS